MQRKDGKLRSDCKLLKHFDEAVALYRQGSSLHDIGKKFRIDDSNVYRLFKSRGIKLRNKSAAIHRAFQTGKLKPMKGDKNPSWRGGKTKHSQGYILIKQPDHPRANHNGYVKEEILVAEKMLGRPLTAKEIVHHRDLIKTNNAPSNLQVLKNNAEHSRVHAVLCHGKIGKNYKKE